MKALLHRSRILPPVVLALALLLSVVPQAAADPGDLDPNFDGDGIVVTDFAPGNDEAFALALDEVGRILLAGQVYSGPVAGWDFALARYLPDGSLDPSFDGDGKVVTDFAASYDYAYAIIVDGSGRIVVAGSTLTGSNHDFALARYNADGSLDATFGDDGRVTTDFGRELDQATVVRIDAAGRIVVAGSANTRTQDDIAVARYNPDGSPDMTFSGDGRVTTDLAGFFDYGAALTLDDAGRIVVAGSTWTPAYSNDIALVRYNPDGSLDMTFDGDGKVTTNFGPDYFGPDDHAADVLVDDAGRIVVTGSASFTLPDVALARYLPDGSLDPAFGGDGKVTTDFAGGSDSGGAVALDATGHVVVAGVASIHSSGDFAVVRYNMDGSLDSMFGLGGKITTNVGGGGDSGAGMALDATGRIVVGGFTNAPAPDNYAFAVVRYLGDEIPPPTPIRIDIRPGDPANVVALATGGKIDVAILSTEQFHAPSEVASRTLTFGHTGVEHSLLTWKGGAARCGAWDVDGDGRTDLVCQFLVKLTGLRVDDAEGVLKGLTLSGASVEGRDTVQIVP